MRRYAIIGLLIIPSILWNKVIWAKITHQIDPETKLQSWKLEDNGVELELIQRLPDQSRAFFQGRGFSSQVADDIGKSCILQVIARNNKDKNNGLPITIQLQNWQVKFQDHIQGIKLKETWDADWSLNEVNKAARIAFRWATFPTEQTFDSGGDYNWGMISIGLNPGDHFNMQVNWTEDKKQRNYWINDMICASDL